MGLCISKQESEQSTRSNDKLRSPRKSSKVDRTAKQVSIEEAIDKVDESKESTENEVEKLKKQLSETR